MAATSLKTKPKASSASSHFFNGRGGILARKVTPFRDLGMGGKLAGASLTCGTSSASDMEESHQQACLLATVPCGQQAQAQPQLRRRRRASGPLVDGVAASSMPAVQPNGGSLVPQAGESSGSKNVPISLGLQASHECGRRGSGGNKHISSSENEAGGGHTPEGSHKAAVSSEEWEDRIQTDETTSSAYSSSCVDSDAESGEGRLRSGRSLDDDGEEKTEYTTSTLHVLNLLQPAVSSSNVTQSDRVSCLIWEGNECKKIDLTALDIGWAIIDKVDSLPESSDYFLIGLFFSIIIGLVPVVFRAYVNKEALPWGELATLTGLLNKLWDMPALAGAVYTWRQWILLLNSVLQRFFLSLIFFFLLSVADRTFKQRLLYAKHFSYLTSSRRARKFSMPHFRLSKVRNIKIWLSLRSYLKRRGPQRSVDVIVSACFMCAICTVSLISLQMLKDADNYLDYLCNWELLVWCCGLAIFLMRFMTVGLKINKKYRNLSVLITEQINLYLQMEQKPHKKEELILANNVLRLAEDLLKELESPFKISGFSANPVIYNIMRVVVLSAFSAVLTEVLGFKLKLHKIKLKG
ncbi:homeodomain transcription factor [Plakobranchus ocellatus]|uniref:Homeodomain transcription factor n=1 Tax=Plakobranchus ocellatus TaxID=259542 RepID=A0AAV3YW75_9GAST|nr:homeodomain transcription factor [Plakobranchus ocellatus]